MTINLKEALSKVKPKNRAKVKEKVAKAVISEIKKSLRSSTSPVTGEKLEPLSKEYQKIKRKMGKGGSANLKLLGDMQSSLDSRVSGNKVTIGIFGDTKEKLKSFNHNTGDTLPKRQFLPNTEEEVTLRGKRGKGQFHSTLLNRIKRIIDANKG